MTDDSANEEYVDLAKALQRILCVEDDPDIQLVARVALETVGGFDVVLCGSGREALLCAEKALPDLILLDVMMPNMDGPTTLAKLREIDALKDIPAVFMTAKVMDPEVEKYRSMGVVDVVAKPFDPMALPDRIRAIWKRCHE